MKRYLVISASANAVFLEYVFVSMLLFLIYDRDGMSFCLHKFRTQQEFILFLNLHIIKRNCIASREIKYYFISRRQALILC